MNLEKLITMKVESKKAEVRKKEQDRLTLIESEAALLSPIIDSLNETLPKYGAVARMHKEPSHQPCPSIQIKSPDGTKWHSFHRQLSEISIVQDSGGVKYKAGAFNGKRDFESLPDLFDFVSDVIAHSIVHP